MKLLIWFGIGLLAALSNMASAAEVVFPDQAWLTKPPAELGLNASRLDAVATALGGRGCVVKDGYVVKAWGDQAEKGDWLSSAKPVLSTLLMFAMQEGRVKSADTPIVEFGWPLEGKDRGITFRHLANMTSGYARPEGPGAAWAYNDYAIQLYQQTLFDRVFREEPEEAANAAGRLGGLGLQDGLSFTPDKRRLKASARDFARIAWFWMNRGKWGDKQLLPARYFDEFMQPQVPRELPVSRAAETNDSLKIGTFGGGSEHFTRFGAGIYGFNWWFNATGREHASAPTWPDAPADTVMSIGAGGNCSVMMPGLRLVAVCAKGDWGKLEAGERESVLNQRLKLIAEAGTRAEEAVGTQKLKVGVAQVGLAPTLAESRDKIVRFVGEAKERGCRVVVFPETSLYWPVETPRREVDAAVEVVRKAVDAADVYALVGGLYKRDEQEKPFERLLVIDPEGRILQTYNKMWGDARFNDCPGTFQIDGVPCAATICADRWIRSVEELPVMAGAKVLFEVSNNYDNEWLPDLGWYWYVPRAMRNEVFVVFANTGKEDRAQNTPGHGHSAVIGPDGAILAAAGEEPDKLLVAELNLSQAAGGQATARRRHPALASFWDTGVKMLAGQKAAAPKHEGLVSPAVEIKLAAAQMACSRDLNENVARIEKLIREAKGGGADVVVFPELAVTGAREEDVAAASGEQLAWAVARIQAAAKEARIYVVCGLPWLEGGERQNCTVAIGPDGKLLTRYGQLAIDRPELFVAGTSTRAMWFDVKGVPCVMTVGRDGQWSEIAEMAAWRGAQVHLHLAYDRDTSAEGMLKRKQVWANLASFRTFTATVNAASPAGLARPSAAASGGSAIWDDYHRGQNRQAGGYGPYSAVRVAEAKEGEAVLYATQKTQKVNPQFGILTGRANRSMTPWYATGAAAIYQESGGRSQESAVVGPFVNGKFKGRIAYSADGNHNDPDDWIASPVALGIFAQCGQKDRLVHFDYNCILPETNAEWEKIHAESVLGAVKHYGFKEKVFFDCRKNLDGALANLAKAIDESSADNPLYFIVAGPMEAPYLAIQKSRPEKRRYVYCISHSRWNDGFASRYNFRHTKRSVIQQDVNWVQIADQNRLLSLSPYGKPGPAESFAGYHWMRDSADAKVRFLWERMQVSTRPDPSDAGMAYFLMTGDEAADPAKLKRLLDGKEVPQPVVGRAKLRLEAENFRELSGYQIEDAGDRTASHRLQVKSTGGAAGSIRTRLAEPFAAASGRYDVDVRYRNDGGGACSFLFFVNGAGVGIGWESAEKTSGWVTHTFHGVAIAAGDSMEVQTKGAPARLDYVELRQR